MIKTEFGKTESTGNADELLADLTMAFIYVMNKAEAETGQTVEELLNTMVTSTTFITSVMGLGEQK